MINVGVATTDITPPAGLAMAGFAARTGLAKGTHDSLTARVLVVNDTALVTVDVIGIDAELSQRIRRRCCLPDHAVTIVASHTHSGPVSMPGRLHADTSESYLIELENRVVKIIEQAANTLQPARTFGGNGIDPGYAKNRRETNGPVDHAIPVLRFDNADGIPIAILTSYACHPVVLAADNLNWSADYPHYVRETLEAAHPGAIALFATGCAGDVNTGHSSASSLSIETKSDRSFATAKTIGGAIAHAVLNAELVELAGGHSAAEVMDELGFTQRETGCPDQLANQWRSEAKSPNDILNIWADWAEHRMGNDIQPISVRCTALNWCGAQIVAMPGEIFAQTALEIRQSLSSSAPLFVLSYADDNPGYVPHRAAYGDGGYEVDEAHRFYGLGATFAPGSAEQLADAGCKAARMAAVAALDGQITKANQRE